MGVIIHNLEEIWCECPMTCLHLDTNGINSGSFSILRVQRRNSASSLLYLMLLTLSDYRY